MIEALMRRWCRCFHKQITGDKIMRGEYRCLRCNRSFKAWDGEVSFKIQEIPEVKHGRRMEKSRCSR
jgi:hypothetical protein